jgi:hypothetical protein
MNGWDTVSRTPGFTAGASISGKDHYNGKQREIEKVAIVPEFTCGSMVPDPYNPGRSSGMYQYCTLIRLDMNIFQ